MSLYNGSMHINMTALWVAVYIKYKLCCSICIELTWLCLVRRLINLATIKRHVEYEFNGISFGSPPGCGAGHGHRLHGGRFFGLDNRRRL